jgi:ATP-dependent RNA helicase RhlE
MTTFRELPLSERVQQNLAGLGYTSPTPIQQQAIPHVAAGRDLIAIAQTGTGKTAAFSLPLLERLAKPQATPSPRRMIRALILTPTRELASQIADSLADYGKGLGLTHTVIFGGVGHEPQRQVLRRGVDILVATPGRLLDLMSERIVDFSGIEFFVLDEADRMLDMGFIHDVKRVIAALPKKRQTLLFSATLPEDIRSLAKNILIDPVSVAVTPPSTTVEAIEQTVTFIPQAQKRALLVHLVKQPQVTRALVFTRTKHGANRMADVLVGAGVMAMAIHGNKSQSARERALDGFKDGSVRVLVATDLAARGIDVDAVSHVVQVDLPEVPEQYVHRIGRTARAGKSGVAWAFCAEDERDLLRAIERTIRKQIAVTPAPTSLPQPPPEAPRPPLPPRGRHGGGGGRGGHSRGGGGGGGGGRGGPSRSSAPSTPSSQPSRPSTQTFRPQRGR